MTYHVSYICDAADLVHIRTPIDMCALVVEPWVWQTPNTMPFITCFSCFLFQLYGYAGSDDRT